MAGIIKHLENGWIWVSVKIDKFRCVSCPKVILGKEVEYLYYNEIDALEDVENGIRFREGICDECHKKLMD